MGIGNIWMQLNLYEIWCNIIKKKTSIANMCHNSVVYAGLGTARISAQKSTFFDIYAELTHL